MYQGIWEDKWGRACKVLHTEVLSVLGTQQTLTPSNPLEWGHKTIFKGQTKVSSSSLFLFYL